MNPRIVLKSACCEAGDSPTGRKNGHQVEIPAEEPEDCEAGSEQRDDRHPRRERLAHAARVELTARQVADHGIRITEQAHCDGGDPGAPRSGAEEAPVEKAPEACPHAPRIL